MTKIYHYEIFGSRESKYNWLNKHNIKNVKWKKVTPYPSFYLFIPTNNKLAHHYYSFEKITDIFPVNSVGIVTARDNFVIDFDKKKLERRIEEFRGLLSYETSLKNRYDLKDTSGWKIKTAREKLRKDLDWKDSITKILYRPFDERWIFYHDEMIERTRKDVMQNMFEENIGLITVRQVAEGTFNHANVTENIVESRITLSNKGIAYLFPLYIYIKSSKKKKARFTQLLMFEPEEEYVTVLPNISKEIISSLCNTFRKPFYDPLYLVRKEEEGEKIDPDKLEGFASKNIFYYIYAILYSNTYRKKYEEFLKMDFPRIPFTKNYKLFIRLGKLGHQLADLHLLKSEDLDKAISNFPVEGNNKIEKLKYENKKVWINKNQFFDGVKEEVWNYQIGGYQVCEKWLKDRKGRKLTLEEVQTYFKTVTAISKTIKLQKEIDKIYEKLELSTMN